LASEQLQFTSDLPELFQFASEKRRLPLVHRGEQLGHRHQGLPKLVEHLVLHHPELVEEGHEDRLVQSGSVSKLGHERSGTRG